jgi:putative spermidine/putrescine transport system substrate-binding protein
MSARIKLLALVSVLAIVAAACGSESDDGTPSAGGDTGSSVDVVDAIGDTEGELNLIAWPGYTEKGWVKPFEDETGCKVSVKYGNTSDDMVNLIRNNPGQYDGVSASGDATNRLIASGNVSAIDPALFPELSDVTASLNPESGANTAHYVVDGNVYGVPYMYGPNFLMFNTDEVSPAPDSWDVVFETEIDGAPNPYAGMVTAYDSAIYIADAALYLKTHQPDLGITDPYELTTDQLDAAVELLKKQATMITKYWAIYTDEIDGFDSGDMVIGTAWPVNQQYITKVPVDNVIPSEGVTGWADTWMMTSDAPHPNCMLKWMEYTLGAKVQTEVALYYGATPSNSAACADLDKELADAAAIYHCGDDEFLSAISLWKTPLPDCGDDRGSTCADYNAWTEKWLEVRSGS